MWLTLEKGTLRHLRRQTDTDVVDPWPEHDGRHPLTLTAAHTVFPEDNVDNLPAVARAEIAAGLDGPLRTSVAAAEPQSDELVNLRDQLIHELSGQRGRPGALLLADHIHLRRLTRGDVPPVIAAGCTIWYGSYRQGTDPQQRVVASLHDLYDAWVQRPQHRSQLDEAMRAEAVSLVGDRPDDLLNAEV